MLNTKTSKELLQKTAIIRSDTPSSNVQKSKFSTNIDFIIHIIIKTWINIAFATSIVSSFSKNQNFEYFNIIDQIFFYKMRSHDNGVTFAGEKE